MMRKHPLRYMSMVVLFVGITMFSIGCGMVNQMVGALPDGPRGNLVITVRQGGIQPAEVLPTSTHLRVRAYGGGLDRNILEDVPFVNGQATASMTIPVGTYTIDLIAYQLSSDGKYGVSLTASKLSGVVIEQDKTTTTTPATLTRFTYSIDVPHSYVKENTDYKISLYSVGANGMTLGYIHQSHLATSQTAWQESAIPNGITWESYTDSGGNSPYYYYNWTKKTPNVYGATVYHQFRLAFSTDYTTSRNALVSKNGLIPLYYFFPTTAYGESLIQAKTTPTGSVVIPVN